MAKKYDYSAFNKEYDYSAFESLKKKDESIASPSVSQSSQLPETSPEEIKHRKIIDITNFNPFEYVKTKSSSTKVQSDVKPTVDISKIDAKMAPLNFKRLLEQAKNYDESGKEGKNYINAVYDQYTKMGLPTPDQQIGNFIDEAYKVGEELGAQAQVTPERRDELLNTYKQNLVSLAQKHKVVSKDGKVVPDNESMWRYDYWTSRIQNRLIKAKENEKDPFVKDVLDNLAIGSKDIMNTFPNIMAISEKIGNAMAAPFGVVPNNYWQSVAAFNQDEIQRLQQENTLSEESITGMLQSGDTKGAAAKTVLDVARNLPMLTTLALGNIGGYSKATLGLMGTAKAADEYINLDRNTDLGTFSKTVSAITKGLNEIVFEDIGTMSILNSVKQAVKESGEQSVRGAIADAYQSKLYRAVGLINKGVSNAEREGLSEMGTELSDYITDLATLGFSNITPQNILDAGIIGAVVGTGLTTPELTSGLRGNYIRKLAKQLPDEYSLDSKVEIIPMLIQRNSLEAEKDKSNPAFHKIINNKISKIDERILEISYKDGVIAKEELPKAEINKIDEMTPAQRKKIEPDKKEIIEEPEKRLTFEDLLGETGEESPEEIAAAKAAYAKFGNAENELEVKNEPLPPEEAKTPVIESNVEPKGNKKNIILYHGTLSDIDEFRPNTHFGSLEQARNRLDYTKQISNRFRDKGKIIPIVATVDKVKEVADADYNWEEVINKAKEEGYDAIKYINKGEIDARKGKEDYSYIIFDPKNIHQLIEPKDKEIGGKENAIQERGTEEIPVGKTPGDSQEVGGRIPEPERPAQTQENAPPGENAKAPGEEINFHILKTKQEFSSAIESEMVKNRQEELTDKENEVKDRLAERLSKLSGSKFAAGDKKPEVAKEIIGVISDLAELGLIKVEKGIDHIIEQVKKYLPQISDADINKYRDDISGFVKDPRLSGIKKSLVPESKIEETEIEKRSVADVMERGRIAVDEGRVDPKLLVDDINKNPRAIQAEEVGSLIYYKTQLDNKFDEAYDRLSDAKAKGEDEGSAKMILDAINKDINDFHEAALNSGYEQGLSFRLRQALMDSEYNITTQIRKYKEANHGDISTDVETKFKEYDKRLQDLNKQLRDLNRKKESEDSKEVIRDIRESTKPVVRIRGKALMAEGFDELMSALGGKTMAMGETAPSVTQALSKIGRGLIDEGIATIDNVMEKISDYLKGKNTEVDLVKYKDDIIGGIRSVSGIKVNDKGKLIIPHDLIREYVEKGMEDINDLVTTIKKDYSLDMPDRELRDMITNYGKTISMNKEDIEVKIREMRRVGRTLSGLEDVIKQHKKPLRNGLQRDKLTDKERRLQKELKEAMKTLPITEEESAEAWKTTLGAVKTRLKNQISDLENQITTGKKTPKKKGIQYDAETNTLKEHRDALKKIIEDTEGKSGISDEQRVRKAIADSEKLIKEYERRIKEKDFSKLNKPSTTPNTPELDATRKRLNSLRSEYRKLKDLEGVTDQERLNRLKENIKKSIKDYERRIKEKDYSKKTRTKPEFDLEAARLEIERSKIKYQYDRDIEKVRLKNRSLGEKSKEIFMDIFNMPKSLMASMDFSAPLRQGAILTFGNLRQAPGAFKEMFHQAFSPKHAEGWLHRLHATDEYVLMHNSKLYISEPTAKLAAKEEQFMTNLAYKIPIYGKMVAGSERAYVGYLNKLRVDIFNKGAKSLLNDGYTFKSNPEVFKAWADFINNATGRGGLGPLEKSAAVLNTAFFSPRLVMSRINLMNPVKYVKMPAPVRIMAMKNMLSFLGTVMAVTTLAKLAGAEVEDDPRSSDFGKVKIGKLRFDMMAGFQQPIRAMVQIWTGQRKSAGTGIVRDLDPNKFPYSSRGDVAAQFVRSKLSPSTSLIVDLLEGQTMLGDDLNAKSLAIDRVTPLYLQDLGKIYKENGIPLTGSAAFLSMFGIGVQYYEEKNVVRQSISDGATLEQTLAKAQNKEDKPLTKNKITDIKKEYKAYKRFGLDNETVNYLLQSGMSNDEKAQYLIDSKVDSGTILKLKNEYHLISKPLYDRYKELKKP